MIIIFIPLMSNTKQIWLLKCCENNSHDFKIFFDSIKRNSYSITHVFIKSLFFHDTKTYFYLIKVNVYWIKYIFSLYYFFNDIKIQFYLTKINLHSTRNIFISKYRAWLIHGNKKMKRRWIAFSFLMTSHKICKAFLENCRRIQWNCNSKQYGS